jgi:hypothetical protein
VRSTAAPYTESRLTRSVANERVGFPVVEQQYSTVLIQLYQENQSENSLKNIVYLTSFLEILCCLIFLGPDSK